MSTIKKFGDRISVWEGLASMTRGGLTKDDLVMSKTGKLVSKKKSEIAKKNYAEFGFAKRKALELGRSTTRATENVVDTACKIIESVPALRQWSRCRSVLRRRTW